jgi:signal transduction histidine kinase
MSAARVAGTLRLTVADNGIGIDAARVAVLGAPFRCLHARRKDEGTRLGVAICKRIAEQHGGHLEIRSVLGEGSRFSLLLPLARAARAAAAR